MVNEKTLQLNVNIQHEVFILSQPSVNVFTWLVYQNDLLQCLNADWRVWISHKIVRNYSFPTSQWYNNAFALRHRMLHFIQNLLYYITIEVLEPSWQLFVEKIRKVDNVDQVKPRYWYLTIKFPYFNE